MTLRTKNLGVAVVEDTGLQAEIRQAIAAIESGDSTGEPPWRDESSD
jgi:hypothetical protein